MSHLTEGASEVAEGDDQAALHPAPLPHLASHKQAAMDFHFKLVYFIFALKEDNTMHCI